MLNIDNQPNLVSAYESIYNQQVPVLESTDTDTDDTDAKVPASKKKVAGKGKKSAAATNYGAESVDYGSYMSTLLKQIGVHEEFDLDGSGDTGETFDFEGGEEGEEDEGEEDEQISVSKSQLQEIIDLLQGLIGGMDDGLVATAGSDNVFDDGAGLDDDDSIPSEGYAFSGGGSEHGDQGTYDGKAKTQSASTHVKSNGDAKVGQTQKTGYKPGQNGAGAAKEHGAKGDYSGKAKTQSASTHVKPNGDAKVGQTQTTGYGKKIKEDLL